MTTLLVRYDIKIPVHHIVGNPGLIFLHWFPENEDVIISKEDKVIRLWFDKDCYANHIMAEDIKRTENIVLSMVHVDIVYSNIAEELMPYFKGNYNIIPDGDFKKISGGIAIDIYETCCYYVNRLLSFARTNLGQYWIELLPTKENRIYEKNIHYNARATTDVTGQTGWFRWTPPIMQLIEVHLTNKESYIKSNDWEDLKKFVSTDKRPIFLLELLSGAKVLNAYGLARNAIVDSITALELALDKFTESPKNGLLDKIKGDPRFNEVYTGLKPFCKHYGFTGTVRFVLPMLFSEQQLEANIHKNVLTAITLRQNIVHNGQKKVETKEAASLILDIERLVKLLIDSTN